MTAKGVLKNYMKDLQFRRKKLTFNPACVPTKTKADRFLTGNAFVDHLLKGNVCQSSLPGIIKHVLKSHYLW